jgi:DNA-binding GntR family transcriptional regulator
VVPTAVKDILVKEIIPRLDSLAGQSTLVTTIVVTLAQEIIEGSLEAGFELTSVDLGKRFNTSRTPVREALAILQREGLVDVRAHHRPRVAETSEKEIHDLYLVRASLYSLVSREIVRTCSDEEIATLLIPLTRMRDAADHGDVDEYFAHSVEFRHIESNICGNAFVGSMIDSLGLRVYRLRRFGLSLPERLQASFADHQHLYQAYVERDEQLARALTESLVLRALRAIEDSLHGAR